MALLGTPDEYNAIIADGTTLEPLAYLPWSSLAWQRSRNKITQGEAFISEADLGVYSSGRSLLSSLRTWNQLLRIERNGSIVWDGPITGWGPTTIRSRGGDKFGVTIRAFDRWVISQKRLIGGDLQMFWPGGYWPLPPSPYPIPFGPFGGGNIAWALMIAAGLFDTPSELPYAITLPGRTDFPSGLGRLESTGVEPNYFVTLPLEREWRTLRLERLSDAWDELGNLGYLSYAQVVDKLWVNDQTMRATLGGGGVRPVLSENTCFNTLAVNVDGLPQATAAYVGRQGTGKTGYARVSTATTVPFTQVVGLLETGAALQQADDRGDNASGWPTGADLQAQNSLYRRAAPDITIEQVALRPTFGSPSLSADLSNLVPGVVVDLDFPETSGTGVAFVDVIAVDRLWCYSINYGENLYGTLLTPVYDTSISKARIEQLDVTVEAGDGGIIETMNASLVPWADWDGHSPPASWLEPQGVGYQRLTY